MRLQGKVAIITGGARGIGRAAAIRFAAEGAILVLVSRTANELETVEREVSRLGGVVLTLVQDVSDRRSAQSVVRETKERFGKIDILVNCAGILRFFPMSAVSSEEFDSIFAVNAKGALFMSQEVLPLMKAQRAGSIVMVSAIGSLGGGGVAPVYRASKAALNSISEALAEESLGSGVRVNSICPAEVRTRMAESVTTNARDQGDWMEPEEIADIILFLASSESRALTGATLIAGGKRKLSRWG